MAVAQEDIDTLNTAIAQGERVVKYRDKTIEYRSIGELIQARNDLRAELAAQTQAETGETRRRQTYVFQSGRGL